MRDGKETLHINQAFVVRPDSPGPVERDLCVTRHFQCLPHKLGPVAGSFSPSVHLFGAFSRAAFPPNQDIGLFCSVVCSDFHSLRRGRH